MKLLARLREIVSCFKSRSVIVAGPSDITDTLPFLETSTVSPVEHASLDHPPPYSLEEMQRIFTRLIASLILHAYSEGYELTLGETWRPPETAELYARKGKGIKGSLHTERLAIDLNLFREGKLLISTEAHKPLGEYWESLATPGVKTCWGGRFSKPDGGHYSIAWGGRK